MQYEIIEELEDEVIENVYVQDVWVESNNKVEWRKLLRGLSICDVKFFWFNEILLVQKALSWFIIWVDW